MQHVKTVKLGEIAPVSPEGYQPRKEIRYYVGLEHIEKDTGQILPSAKEEPITTIKNRFYTGEILYGKLRPYLNKVALASREGVCSTDILVLRPSSEIEPRYLFHYMLSDGFVRDMSANVAGANLPRVSTKYILNYPIPLPDLDTQRHIAAVLDKANELRQKDRQLVAYYEQLPQAVFLEMFGDYVNQKKDRLSQFVLINPRRAVLDDDMSVSFIPMNAVGEKGEFNGNTVRQVRDVKTGFTYFAENDVLFAKITPCMENGKGAIARALVNGVGFGSTEFHVLRANADSTPEFIYHLLAQESVRKFAEDSMTGSAGQKRVSVSFFDKLKIAIPPLTLQNQFAETVTQIEQQKGIVKQQLATSEALFQSLLHEYFGKIS